MEDGSPADRDQLLDGNCHVHVLVDRAGDLIGTRGGEYDVDARITLIYRDAWIRELGGTLRALIARLIVTQAEHMCAASRRGIGEMHRIARFHGDCVLHKVRCRHFDGIRRSPTTGLIVYTGRLAAGREQHDD